MMGGLVDLHLHYIPGVDDGVRSADDGIALCQGLYRLGYRQLVATPHIRTAMFENRKPGLARAFADFAARCAGQPEMPALGLAAEHFCDDVFWGLFEEREALPYPGGHAALIEFPEGRFPIGIEDRFFQMRVRGVAPVLAHPERYRPLFRSTEALDGLRSMGLIVQLDLMSLMGRYGRRPRKAAERMLEEDVYYIACSDAHRSEDVPVVAQAIDRLRDVVGEECARRLLSENPRRLLAGTADL